MNKSFIIFALVIVLLIFGLAFVIAGTGPSKATIEKTIGAKASFDATLKDLQDIKYGEKAIVNFPIENNGSKNLEIANIATSCMCTLAHFERNGSQEGPAFGMKGMSSVSDWKGVLKPGEKVEIVAIFDTAYHGPSGVGSQFRTVSLETNDPDNPYIEFNFTGEVVK
ncbi:DUF1573 domain-containing protein [Patescibacteria group bacterium]|nr:DUF1573 domain-containing protein [Patescibacteria group bacterium]